MQTRGRTGIARLRHWLIAGGLGLSMVFGRQALASEFRSITVWSTVTPAGDVPSRDKLHRPLEAEGPLYERAQELDATLREGAQDLGFSLQVAMPTPETHLRDVDLLEYAASGGEATRGGSWVISPRLEAIGGGRFLLRIVVVQPFGQDLRIRSELVSGPDVSARGLVMLRALLADPSSGQAPPSPPPEVPTSPTPPRSAGRAILAANMALFGGYSAYSIQRASGSDDPRVLYPLLALGTGLGMGTALLVTEEWNLSPADAWILAAGAWWGAGAGILLANGQEVKPLSDRYNWGVGGGLAGLTVATLGLSRTHFDDGDAALTHSGAALGMILGGAAELASEGSLDGTPSTGAAIGVTTGLIGAGLLATQVSTTPSRVFLIDLGVGLGALGGAAAASPLLFEDVSRSKNSAFLLSSLAGSIAGGTTAWMLTRHGTSSTPPSHVVCPQRKWLPLAGVLGESRTFSRSEPIYGIGLFGDL